MVTTSPPDPATSERGFDVAGASGPRSVLWWTVVPVWMAAVALSAVVVLFVPNTAGLWFSIAFGLCTLLAFAIQLAVPKIHGHMARLGWALGGSLMILGLASLLPFVILPAL